MRSREGRDRIRPAEHDPSGVRRLEDDRLLDRLRDVSLLRQLVVEELLVRVEGRVGLAPAVVRRVELVRPRRSARAAGLQQRADHALQPHQVAQDRLLAESDRAPVLAPVRAIPPAVVRAALVEEVLDHALRLVEDRPRHVQVPRREHGQVAGLVVPELVAVEGRLRLVVAQHFDERERLGLGDQRVVAVEILAGQVAARVGGATVAVDRRDDQHGRARQQAQGTRVVGECELPGQDQARLAGRRLVAVHVAVDQRRRRAGDRPDVSRRGRVPDHEHVDRPALERAADLNDANALAGVVERGGVGVLVRIARELRCLGRLPLRPQARAGGSKASPLRQRRVEHRGRERLGRRADARAHTPLEAVTGVEPGLCEGRGAGSDRAVRPPDADDHRRPGRRVVRPDGRSLDLVVGRAGHRVPAERRETVRLFNGHAADLIDLLRECRSRRQHRGDEP